jgi:PAS domain S-box-containing protein
MIPIPLPGGSAAKLAAIIEAIPTALIMIDTRGAIVMVNREAENVFGYSREEFLAIGIESLVPDRFRGNHPAMREGFHGNPQARRMGIGRDLYALRKDGSEFPVEIGLNPIEAESERYVLSAIVDITERRRSEDLFRATVESAPSAMIMIDEKGRMILANAEAVRMFGYAREELIGQAVEILVPARFRAAHPGMRGGFFGAPQARTMGAGRDLFGARKDGSEFPVEIGLNPVETPDGRFVLSAIVDITERKRMEAALRDLNEELEKRVHDRTAELARANEAMERSNIELKQFAYIASHDLQAPLRSISGFVQLLKQDYGAKLDGQAEEWIRRTVESTQYMQTLIKDLLSYSQVDSRARPFSAVDCGHAFDEAVAMLDGSIRDSGAAVTRDDLPSVLGDRSQLVQLFMNLISNGIKYHGAEPPRVHASARVTDGKWTITLRDNGIGIAPKHHERIFEIFQRLHTRRAYPGTGIGLAVCRRVVEHHGGSIGVDSSPGQGAAFHFTIPDRKDLNP